MNWLLAIENQLLLSSCLLAAAVVLGTRRPVLAGASAASGGFYLLSLASFLRGRGWRPVGPLLFGFLRRKVPLSINLVEPSAVFSSIPQNPKTHPTVKVMCRARSIDVGGTM